MLAINILFLFFGSGLSQDTFIVDGENAREGEYPYVVSIRETKFNTHQCVASILTSKWLLTAADCCHGSNGHIQAGSIFLSGGGQVCGISKVIIHYGYNYGYPWRNDICLIRLDTELDFNENVNRVTLCNETFVGNGDLVDVVGWGLPGNNGHEVSDRLQVGYHLEALDSRYCALETEADITKEQICVKSKRTQGGCKGDLGAPLTKKGIQVGVFSWSVSPCGYGRPDVYTRISSYIDWIVETLEEDACLLLFGRPESDV